ncbi:MAG: RNase adapter RapZ, partial [Alphaproteobacteria bacterium]|nr:RNase adapter RapZ [Alphaproteobacteria bacterium]
MSTSSHQRIVLVSGLSGAGKTTALKSLEDMGFEAVDNLPLSLLDAIIHSPEEPDNAAMLALGIDSRTRAFDPVQFVDKLETLRAREGIDLSLIYLDAADEVLQRRFTETRRRHPLASDRPVQDGIDQERRLMAEIKEAADFLIDTSGTSAQQLKQLLERNFRIRDHGQPALTVLSFSYRRGLPREADLVFDVRFLRNPHYEDTLKPYDGRDNEVGAYISA